MVMMFLVPEYQHGRSVYQQSYNGDENRRCVRDFRRVDKPLYTFRRHHQCEYCEEYGSAEPAQRIYLGVFSDTALWGLANYVSSLAEANTGQSAR